MADAGELLIIGCGTLGEMIARAGLTAGLTVTALNRSGKTTNIPGVRWLTMNGADPEVIPLARAARLVVVCANPGVRRGRDNGVAVIANNLTIAAQGQPILWTGSTAVYADADGGDVNEDGILIKDDPGVGGLLNIERAFLQIDSGRVLRFPALVGPGRTHLRTRLAQHPVDTALTVHGDLDRPFAFLHDRDAAAVVLAVGLDNRLTGLPRICNAASPQRLTVREYYAIQATLAGIALPPLLSEGQAPRRMIRAEALWRAWPQHRYHLASDP